MIHILINLPKKYDIILDCIENHLMMSEENELTIEKKLNNRYKKIKNKNEEKRKKEKALGPMISSVSKCAISVVSMVMNKNKRKNR